ncbi:MAG: hypothetical protein Q9181_003153 [Wetmoreana brouardii]
MASTYPHYPGNKRGACDRCRGQKLRCSREGQNGTLDSTKCVRCAKADAVCIFSTSMKSGRPTAANAKSSKRKESRKTNPVASWEAMATDEQEDYALNSDTIQTDFLEQSLRDDAFGMLTAESLGEEKGSNRRLAPTIDTSSMPVTLEDFSASDASSFSVGEHLDFLNPLETSNMTTTATNGGLHLLSAQYPIDFGPFIQDYHQLSQQGHDIDPQNLPGSFAGDARNGSNGAFPAEGRTPARTSSDTRLSEAAPRTPQRSRPNNHHAKPLSAGQSVHSQTKSGDEMDCDNSSDLSFTTPSSKTRPETKPSYLPCPPAPSQDIRHRRMQELSDLGMTLYAQVLETASPALSTSPPKSSPQPPFTLAGKVLSGSIKFLHLLTNLYSTCPSVASSPTTNEILDKRKPSNSVQDDAISHYSPSSSSSDLNVTAPSFSGVVEMECNSPLLSVGPQSKHRHSRSASKIHQRKRTRSPSQFSHPTSGPETKWQVGTGEELGVERHQPADVTEVFALLTCYIRLLQLHSLLYARITEFLISFSQEPSSSSTSNQAGVSAAQGYPSGHSSAPNLSSLGATSSASRDGIMDGTSSSQNSRGTPAPLFPGLCLNGVCLDNFANFQIKFLLQITAHTLGEIECVLGLPEGYRVSRRDSTFGANAAANGIAGEGCQGRRGILDTGCVSKGFIEMTMESTGRGAGTGTGSGVGDKLMCIRDHLVKLRKLLKGTINP